MLVRFLFVVLAIALPIHSQGKTTITLSRSNGTQATLDHSDFAIVKRSRLTRYKSLKEKVRELELELKRAKAEIQAQEKVVYKKPKKDKKNRIYIYGGINQGALTVTESLEQGRGKHLSVYQRTAYIGGFGYTRNVYGPFNLSAIFLYQGIYIGGIGFDF